MEGSPFAQPALTHEALKKEEMEWAHRIDQVKDYLEKEVDFTLLGDIISDVYKRVYPELSIEEIKEKLRDVYHPHNVVKYIAFPDSGVDIDHSFLALTNGETIKYSAGLFFREGRFNKSELLHTVVHEVVHVASQGKYNTGITQVEVLDTENGEEEKVSYFNNLNEGMTEYITDAIYSEYLARSGNLTHEDYQKYDEESGIAYGFVASPATYLDERIDVYYFITSIAEIADIPIEKVVQSLIAEYFRNGELDREEVVKAFKEYPNIVTFIIGQKDNLTTRYNSASHEYILEKINTSERFYIKALFGRDVVGSFNKKVKNSLY